MKELTMKTIFLGSYFQSNDKNKEPIEWIVLKEEEDKMYVLSKYCLDAVPYSNEHKTAWRYSHMREWLNNYFLSTTFSSQEQDKILLSTNKTHNNKWSNKGTSTQEKIFLPSISEVSFYFGATGLYDILLKQKRIARPTQFAFEHGCRICGLKYGPVRDSLLKNCILRDSKLSNGAINSDVFLWQRNSKNYKHLSKDSANTRFATSWYLRSSGNEIMYIDEEGEVVYIENKYIGDEHHTNIAVRPAMWVKK